MYSMVGQQFGKLKVVSSAGSKGNGRLWNCLCECGGTKITTTGYLRAGRSSNCGCVQRERCRLLNRLPVGEAPLNRIYASYKKRALDKGLEFALTKEEFHELILKPCHYCGVPPSNNTATIYKQGPDSFLYNGVDRIDNSGGYITGNIVACCAICNHAKHMLSYEDFITYLRRVAKKWVNK